MRYAKLSILGLSLFLYSCQGKEKEYNPHYDKDKIIGVLIDLYAAEAAMNNIHENMKDSLISLYSSQIETIHNIDMDLMERDIQDLQLRPKLYKTIHQQVQDSIVLLEKAYNKKKEKKITKKEKKTVIKDSLGLKKRTLPTKRD